MDTMAQRVNKHLTWGISFRDANRIEANFNEHHPDFPVHDHEFMEIVVVVAGSCLHRNVLGEQRLGKGDAFLMRPGAWHAFLNCRNLTLYNCCFDPGILSRELSWMIDDPNLGRLLWSFPLSPAQHGMVLMHFPDSELTSCRKILDMLCALTTASIISHRADRVGLLVLLLGALSRQLPGVAPTPKPTKPHPDTKPHPATLAALKLMDDDPTWDWSLETLAERVNTNPDYLARAFSKVAGLPPMAYLRRRRLELATMLLANSEHLVSDVGSLVGWPDPSYFTRRFRVEFGLSPSAYRVRFLKTQKISSRSGPNHRPSGKVA